MPAASASSVSGTPALQRSAYAASKPSRQSSGRFDSLRAKVQSHGINIEKLPRSVCTSNGSVFRSDACYLENDGTIC